MPWTPILISIFILLLLLAFWQMADQKKYQNAIYLTHLQHIKSFLDLTNSFNDYVTWVQRDQIITTYAETAKFFKYKTNYYRKEAAVKQFNDIYKNFYSYIVRYNRQFVQRQKEKLKLFFDDIEGKKLDDQQRMALITDEYSNLIIAGAGSGKTLTILGKVKYLLEQKNIHEEDILLLSFTKNTVEELNERLLKMALDARATTFHKLGYDTIKRFQSKIPVITNDNTLELVIESYFRKHIFDDEKALSAYIQYVACYMNVPEAYDNFTSLGEKLDTEKGIDFQTLKSKCTPLNRLSKANLDTIQGERVKSTEELIIANYLYLNGIEYEYERPYPFGDVVYRPDFYLTDYDIYLEHFGIDEHYRAKWLTPLNEEAYVEGVMLKRQTHKTYNTKLLETYSYYNRDNILLHKLEEMLLVENVVFKPRDRKVIFTKVSENDKNFGKELVKLIESFINLGKSKHLNAEELRRLYSDRTKIVNDYMLERQALFLQFVLPIFEMYEATLKSRIEIDFNDMINHATELIHKHQPQYTYRYIIVDEYQDISYARFKLIKAIRDLCGARLICVGDDWQSIYRFAGSDISLFSDFEKYVGKYEKLLIERTYRNTQSLIDITSAFIQKNKKQISKNPQSTKPPLQQPIKYVHHKSENIVDTFIHEIQLLVDKYGKKPIMVLGRHSFDIHDLIQLTTDNKIRCNEQTSQLEIRGFQGVDIKYLTVHRSKGMEADNVIILNLKNHLLGFPNKITDDVILHLLLSEEESFRFAEERRLFYVALTRTKNEAILLIPTDISVFVEELLLDHQYVLTTTEGNVETTRCPYCKTGHLVVKQNTLKGSSFVGCTHYPSCHQTFDRVEILEKKWLCPECKSGFMTQRNGKFGSFMGCTNYPRCNKTIDIESPSNTNK